METVDTRGSRFYHETGFECLILCFASRPEDHLWPTWANPRWSQWPLYNRLEPYPALESKAPPRRRISGMSS